MQIKNRRFLWRTFGGLLFLGASLRSVAQPPPAVSADCGSTLQQTPIISALHSYQLENPCKIKARKWLRTAVMPMLMVGAGLASAQVLLPFNQYETQEEIQEHLPLFHTRVDDYLIWAPTVGLAALLVARVPARQARLSRLLGTVAVAGALTGVLVQGLKKTTAHLRPDGVGHNSFPSGHTAQAFVGAAILDCEFRDSAPWVGPAAYTVATSVGVLRMLNNRHWQSDVLVGAGLGLAVGQVVCALADRPARTANTVQVAPLWAPGGQVGLAIGWHLSGNHTPR